MVECQQVHMTKLNITLLNPLGLVSTLTMLFLWYLLTPVFVREIEWWMALRIVETLIKSTPSSLCDLEEVT